MTGAPEATAARVLREAWTAAEGDPGALDAVTLSGGSPMLPSSFPVDALAQGVIAAAGLAAAELWRLRTGVAQEVRVDRRHAAIAFRSERLVRTDAPPPPLWDPLAGLYPTGDGRYVRIHTNFAHHRDGVLALLGAANARDDVARALLGWEGQVFEDAAAAHGLVATLARSESEWAAHPQGAAVRALPLLDILPLGPAPPEPLPAGVAPLSGVRVLDLTRIIAGPVGGRTLAAHGADVLLITSPRLPSIPVLVIDTGRGKLSAHLDLDAEADRARLAALVRAGDVFIQGYRPGGLAAKGFAPEDLARMRPGIVAVTLSAYGHRGPWAGRRGFDSLTQNANGINHSEAAAAGSVRPKELPCQALDHAAGYLIALGVMAALHRRTREGGSWHVRVSLAQVGEWLKRLPRADGGLAVPEPGEAEIAGFLETAPSGFGPLTAVRHPALLSATPAGFVRPSVPLGTSAAAWPAR
jgi:crotonobetainyl-CoA:carnitine CoA-transferase CaiB-like acyl-CoA transferase